MASEWIKHVKNYAKEHGIKYGEALKKASSTFNSSTAVAEKPTKMMRKSNRKSKKSRKSRRTRRR
jgi:hypothetical protein